MVRQLKHHEQKLLRKVDFASYKQDNNHRDHLVARQYGIQKPEDYHRYNRICGVSVIQTRLALSVETRPADNVLLVSSPTRTSHLPAASR